MSGENQASQTPSLRTLTLLIVRHGITAWNAEGRLQGQTDVPLAPAGQAQAHALGRRLAAWHNSSLTLPALPGPPVAVYASDLSRAQETAEIILAETCESVKTLPVRITPLLRERNFGEWEGLTLEEARARFGPERSHRDEGESHEAVLNRMLAALAQIWTATLDAAKADRATVLVVGHGGSLRRLAHHFDTSTVEAANPRHLDNTGLCCLELHGTDAASAQGIIRFWNDTTHLTDSV